MTRPTDTNQWIVIVNKVPRGPLTKDEIRILLDEGVPRARRVEEIDEGVTRRPCWAVLSCVSDRLMNRVIRSAAS